MKNGYLVYLNGKFFPEEEAKISVFDRALLYGDAVFEGIRVYNGKVWLLDEHIDRLYDSMKGLMMEIPLSKEEMKKAICETVKVNNVRNCHIRPMVTRGTHKGGGLAGIEGTTPNIIITITPGSVERRSITGEELKGLTAITSSVRRIPPQCLDQKIKCIAYVNNLLAALQLKAAGVGACIMLDIYGFIAEGWGYNIFMIKNKKIFTSFPTSSLNGITRQFVMNTLSQRAGYEVEERDATLQEVYTADEIFATGTGAELFPIIEVDGRKIGGGTAGPITKKLMDLFRELTTEDQFLTPVYV